MYVGWQTYSHRYKTLNKNISLSNQLSSNFPIVTWNVLDQLTSDQLNDLDKAGITRKLEKGDYIFRSGENAGGVYFLKSGKVKVSHVASSGKEVILWFCFGGDIFGLAETMQCGEREVNAQACDQSEVLSISQDNFNAYLFQHPQFMFLLLRVMASRLRCLSDTLANVAGERVDKRFVRLLFWLCTRYGSPDGECGTVINVPLKHQEIADMIGATRQTVTSLIGGFKKQGILAIQDHRIHIIQGQKLACLLS